MVIAPPASRYIPVISQLISSFKNPRDPQLKKNILQRRQAKISPDDLHFLNTIWHPMKFHDQPWSTTISTMINHDINHYQPLYQPELISLGSLGSPVPGVVTGSRVKVKSRRSCTNEAAVPGVPWVPWIVGMRTVRLVVPFQTVQGGFVGEQKPWRNFV